MSARPAVAAALALATLLSACSDTPREPTVTSSNDPHIVLAARTTSGEAVARYERMQQSIRAELDAALGPFPWEQDHTGDTSDCGGPWTGTGAETVFLDPWIFDGAIPDARWPQARAIIVAIIGGYGFTRTSMQLDQAGRRVLTGTDPELGAVFTIDTEVNTDMQVTTGCHRPG